MKDLTTDQLLLFLGIVLALAVLLLGIVVVYYAIKTRKI